MKVPESINKSTEIGKGEVELTIEQFTTNKFKTTQDDKDRFHTKDLFEILAENENKLSLVEAGRLFHRMGIGKYFERVNVDGRIKGGFRYLKNTSVK
jgi:hypothetical protein